MRESTYYYRLRFAAILVVGITVTHGAVASETPMNAGHVRYTAKQLPKQSASQGQAVVPEIGPWQVASVEASMLPAQSAMIGTRPATFELPAAPAFETDVRAANQGMVIDSSSAPTKSREPGFWATALSTLALGLFFFLRRLA